MRLGRALGIAVCGSIVALAACSDGGDPVVLPSTSASTTSPSQTEPASTSPSSDPTPTTTLVLPDEHVPEVDEFVRLFFDTYNATQDTGDFTAFDAMYLPQCTGCIQMRDELAGWLADGGVVDGADWVILQQSSSQAADDFNALVAGYRSAGSLDSGSEIEQSSVQLFTFFISSSAMAVVDLGMSEAG